MLNMAKMAIAIKAYQTKLEQFPIEKVKELEETFKTLSVSELVQYQEIKSLAQIKQIIDLETSLFIYNALGNWDKEQLSTKIAITALMGELVKMVKN